MSSCNYLFLLLFIFQLIISLHCQDDSIGFPENIDENKRPADDRNALFMPNQCQEDELLYPGDQKDDWICDCKPAYLYYPPNRRCYPAYEKGPCDEGKILIMPEDSFIPICEVNSCPTKQVRFQVVRKKGKRLVNKCVLLGTPCDVNTQRLYGVNATTLKVECLLPPRDRFNTPVILPPVSAEETSTKKSETLTKPNAVNPRLGLPDEETGFSTGPNPVVSIITNDPGNLYQYIGERLVVKYDVCFPGCRRIIENKCHTPPIKTKP